MSNLLSAMCPLNVIFLINKELLHLLKQKKTKIETNKINT